MKIKLLKDIIHNGIPKNKGQEIEILDRNYDKWVSKGLCESIKKEYKAKKETKELKVSKETKDEANKD